MNIGIIGTGARSIAYLKVCLSDIRENVHVKALAEIDEEKLKQYVKEYLNLQICRNFTRTTTDFLMMKQ